jgi:hypothetical protein
MTDRELMQQALYALEYASDITKPENMSGCGCPICVTITALSERLVQPEPLRPWVGLEQSDMPEVESPMFDHQYFIAGMAFAAKVLEEKNT